MKVHPRILLGTPVNQKQTILKEFLASVMELNTDNYQLDYYFIDNNEELASKELLLSFKEKKPSTIIEYVEDINIYKRNHHTHFWNDALIWRVADYKNKMIQKAITDQYDYLFLVDSDLILHPKTIDYLIKAEKDIISEVFWTNWQPNTQKQPQVWMFDEYKQWEQSPGERLTDNEVSERYQQFIKKMQTPGVYEVGGLGACTLISKKALLSGVNFNRIKNLSFWGEDRHFCIRAAAIGLSLYVDTHVPPLHLYRESDLEEIESYKAKWENSNIQIEQVKNKPKLTLSMIVKNEGGRYLRQVLESHLKYIDEAVIIDDGSTDDSVAICLDVLKDIPVHLVKNEESRFSNEVLLRKQQWEETISTNPDWILNLDADEIFEDRFADEVQNLLNQDDFDVFCFRLYDFWTPTHYREDQYWRAHLFYRPFLFRYKKEMNYKWRNSPQHCGRFPENIFELPNCINPLRVKHLGWINPQDRLEKYNRYKQLDEKGIYGNKNQYISILDENPNLIQWEE